MSIVNKDKENSLSHTRLTDLLEYLPDSGIFIWKVARGPRAKNTVAGNLQTNGYRQIRLDGILFLEHRLAWFYTHKEWPKNIIDHIDGNPSNNKLDNLRDISQKENLYNTKIPSHNTSGIKGVSFNSYRNKYEAYISLDNIKKNLGLFNTIEEAKLAYDSAVLKYRKGILSENSNH